MYGWYVIYWNVVSNKFCDIKHQKHKYMENPLILF